jgi:hypothetical protein
VPWGAVLQNDAPTTCGNCRQPFLIVADRHRMLARRITAGLIRGD